MTIENGKIKKSKTKEDQEFRKKLKYYLKSWYNLELNDITFIMKEIGITTDNYDIVYDRRHPKFCFNFKVIDYFNTIYVYFEPFNSEIIVYRTKPHRSDTYYLSRNVSVRKK